METHLRRLALALLCGFGTFVLTLPVACGGLLLYGDHLNGDVQSGGPQALLGGMAVGGVLALLVACLVWVKSASRA
jgi:hypothetical protein